MFRRVVALTVVAASLSGQAALCAGWALTAAERMACCESEATCPMHASPAVSGQGGGLTQQQADACCASSQKGAFAPSTGAALSVPVIAAQLINFHQVTPVSPPSRSADPLKGSSRPRHVLLSVFLV